jgi:hypothetical protein
MAQLPLIRELQVQIANAPNAPMPQVSFGERDAGLAFQAQARYQGAAGDVFDRMTQSVFGMAGQMSQRAGLQFAAENPLTAEQLQAMAKGDMSTVKLGSPLNVFNSAVRKARAIELSGHAEIEGRKKMVDLIDAADRGQITTQQVRDQVTALTNGYGQSISQVDPEAAFKFRASMATAGGQVIEKTAQLDSKRRLAQNAFKLQTDMDSKIKLVETYLTNERPIDRSTGKPFDINRLIAAEYENFINNATSMVGGTQAAQLGQQLLKSIGAAKANVITNAVINGDRQIGGDFLGAVNRLQKGSAGLYSDVYNSMTLEQRASLRTELRNQTVDIERAQDRARGFGKENAAKEARRLIADYMVATSIIENPDDQDSIELITRRRGQIQKRLMEISIETGIISPEYVMTLPEKSQTTGERNYRAETKLKDDVKQGRITKAQFWDEVQQRGIRQDLAAPIFDLFDPAAAKDDNAVEDYARLVSRTVRGQFNLTARQAEQSSNFIAAVDDEHAKAFAKWESDGRKGAPPLKRDVAASLYNKQRSSKIQDRIDFQVKEAKASFGPEGTIKKTKLDFEDLDISVDANGNPIDLDPDLIAQMYRQGFKAHEIDRIRQYALAIEKLRQQRDQIR